MATISWEPRAYTATRYPYTGRIVWLAHRWAAYVDHDYTSRYLGDFPTPEAAQQEVETFLAERRELGGDAA